MSRLLLFSIVLFFRAISAQSLINFDDAELLKLPSVRELIQERDVDTILGLFDLVIRADSVNITRNLSIPAAFNVSIVYFQNDHS